MKFSFITHATSVAKDLRHYSNVYVFFQYTTAISFASLPCEIRKK